MKPPKSDPDNNFREKELPLEGLNKKAVKAGGSLLGRQVITRLISFAGMIVLARILTPEMFGIFAIAIFVVDFFQRFADFGLSATLLRKPGLVSETELRTIFTIQQSIVGLALIAVFFIAGPVTRYYELDSAYIWLIRVLGIVLLLSSFQTIPSVLIQRQLRHDKLAGIGIIQILVYQSVTIILALMGFEVWALVFGTLSKALVGTILIFRLAWWRPRLGFDMGAAKEVLNFGLPLQLSSLVNLANESVIPVVIGSLFGPGGVGFVNWSRNLVGSAVKNPLSAISKVQMQVFSRVQEDRALLKKSVAETIFWSTLIVIPALALLLGLIDPFIKYVVTEKWRPAQDLIYLLGISFAFFIFLTVFQELLKALGYGWVTFYNSITRLVISIGFIFLLAPSMGILSFAVATGLGIIIVTAHVLIVLRRQTTLDFKVIKPAFPIFLAGALCGGATFLICRWIDHPVNLLIGSVAGMLVYYLTISLFFGKRIVNTLQDLIPKRLNIETTFAGHLLDRLFALSIRLNGINSPPA